MAIVLQTNVASLNAQRNLEKSQGILNKSLQRLSSGLRINSAADDAAGLAISESFKAQIRSFEQAQRNAGDGTSLLQTAEGAMGEVAGILVRLRELAVQASTGTLGDTERGYLNDEFSSLVAEIDRISDVTEFNGISLINGDQASGVTFQVGMDNSTQNRITVSIADVHSSSIGSSASTSRLNDVSIGSSSAAQSALSVIDDAIADVSNTRGGIGAAQNRLMVTVSHLSTSVENITAANSRIRDVDVAGTTAEMTRSQIMMQAGVAVLAQANQMPSVALSLLG
jgi:flagellin